MRRPTGATVVRKHDCRDASTQRGTGIRSRDSGIRAVVGNRRTESGFKTKHSRCRSDCSRRAASRDGCRTSCIACFGARCSICRKTRHRHRSSRRSDGERRTRAARSLGHIGDRSVAIAVEVGAKWRIRPGELLAAGQLLRVGVIAPLPRRNQADCPVSMPTRRCGANDLMPRDQRPLRYTDACSGTDVRLPAPDLIRAPRDSYPLRP